MQSDGELNILTGAGLYLDREKTFDYGNPSKFAGKIEGDITADDSTIVMKVADQLMDADGAVTIKGEYGTLVMNADGTYTYIVEKPKGAPADWKPPYGKVDSFQVITKDANGKQLIDTLNIKIGIHSAGDDFNNITVQESNIEEKVYFIADKDASGRLYKNEFEIKDNQVVNNLKIYIDGNSDNIVFAKTMTIDYLVRNLDTGEVVYSASVSGKNVKVNHIDLGSYPAGRYEIEAIAKDGKFNNIEIYEEKVLYLDEFTASKPDPITGYITDSDKNTHQIDSIKLGNKEISYSDKNKGADSITLEGQYGTLVLDRTGKYTYTPKGGVYGIDKFIYETTSKAGTKESATLEINVGKTVNASIHDDKVSSSSADDEFNMGKGGDTVIFTNLGDPLGSNGGNGANGLDKWLDFDLKDGDTIDVSQLLDGKQTLDNIDQYLKFEKGVLSVDRLGKGNFEEMLKTDVEGDLNSILGNIKWEAPASVEADPAMMSRSIDLGNVESFVLDVEDQLDIAPLSVSLDDLIFNEGSDEITFLDGEDSSDAFVTPQANQAGDVTSVLDVQPTVDPLEDLLGQNNPLV